MKQVGGWWISGHPGSPDPIAEQRAYDVGVIEAALPRCKKRRLVLQAGARAGLWPTVLAAHFERVICFEPEPKNWSACHLNLAKLKNVALYQQALGPACRRGLLRLSDRNDGTHHLTNMTGGSGRDCVDVDIRTIDSLELEDLDAVFLDVEGMEVPVLQGALATIRHSMPVLVLEENVLCQRYGYHRGDLEKLLEPIGYELVERYGRIKPTHKQPFPGADLIFAPR